MTMPMNPLMDAGPLPGGYQPGLGTEFRTGGPQINTHYMPQDAWQLFQQQFQGQPGRPKKQINRKSNVSLDELHQRAERDIKTWVHRNTRMQQHQDQVEIEDHLPRTSDDEDAVVLNDSLGILMKLTGMCSKQPDTKEVRPRRPELRDSAQSIKYFLEHFDEHREAYWADGLHNPVKFEEFQQLFLRGWVCGRVQFDSDQAAYPPDDDFDYQPICVELFDSAQVYPNATTGKYTRVTHRYMTTKGELLDNSEFPDAEKALGMFDRDDTPVELTAVYEFNDRFDYHAVYVSKGGDRVFLKEPTPIGYQPWVITLAGGMFYRQTPWRNGETTEHTAHMGVGILQTIYMNQKYLNRYVSMAASMVGDSANPFINIFSKNDDDEAPDGGFKRGGSQTWDEGAKIEPMTKEKDLNMVVPLIQLLQDRTEKYTLPKMAYAAGDGSIASGYMASLYQAAATDIIQPYIKSWELFRAMVYKKVLEVFEDYGPLDQPIMITQPPNPQTGSPTWGKIYPSDVEEQGTYVRISLDPMTIQDKINVGQLAVALVDKNIISRDTARGADWLRLDDPSLEDMKIISELAKTDPMVIQSLVPLMLSATGQQVLLQAWQMYHMQTGQPNGPPGGGGPPGGTPPRQSMMPGQVAPPQAQGMNQQAALDARGQPPGPASGGIGMGGTPPPTPRTNIART